MTHYLTLMTWPDRESDYCGPFDTLEEAAGYYDGHRIEGCEGKVFRVDPAIGLAAAMMVEVTEEADALAEKWAEERHADAPEAISDPTDDRYDEWRAMEAVG